MIKFLIFISICIAENPVDHWIDKHADILKDDIKSISFKLNIESKLFKTQGDSLMSGKIIVGKKKNFRFEMGPRTVVSDGKVWKSYDARTNQILIQDPDKQLEKSIFAWVKYKNIKVLPVKLENDGGFRLKLLGKENDVRAYFYPDSGELKSITIVQSDITSEITNVILSSEKLLDLNIGNKETVTFDLR